MNERVSTEEGGDQSRTPCVQDLNARQIVRSRILFCEGANYCTPCELQPQIVQYRNACKPQTDVHEPASYDYLQRLLLLCRVWIHTTDVHCNFNAKFTPKGVAQDT